MRSPFFRTRNIAILLLVVSFVLYCADYSVFGRPAEIAAGFLGNLAFLPIYVLFVTLMIERVFRERERLVIRQKLNMVIGVFFSEMGTELVRTLSDFLPEAEDLTTRLKVTIHWNEPEFRAAASFLGRSSLHVDSRMGDLGYLRHFLLGKRDFMLRLLENPNLLEHDEFTDLLWAITHLLQEIEARRDLAELPEADRDHLSGDIKRAYSYLLREWLVYMKHLKHDYPYLFSLAVRMNPMDPEARAEITER
jgi:hypothetical protein